jgi:hypothetical protein
VTDHFQQHPEAEACYIMYKAISWLFYVGTGLLESEHVSVIIYVSAVFIGCLPPSHADSANVGCLEPKPTTKHRSPNILCVVLGTDDPELRHDGEIIRMYAYFHPP